MEWRFVTTMNEIPGYEIVETRGVFVQTMGFKGPEGMIERLASKAENDGCNAVIRVRFVSGYGGGNIAYGDGVVIRPKSDKVSGAPEAPEAFGMPELPEVPDFTNPDNLMNY